MYKIYEIGLKLFSVNFLYKFLKFFKKADFGLFGSIFCNFVQIYDRKALNHSGTQVASPTKVLVVQSHTTFCTRMKLSIENYNHNNAKYD